MIDIDLDGAFRQPDRPLPFTWEGDPGFEGVRLAGPLRLSGQASVSGDSVRMAGDLRAQLLLECSRCLRPVEWNADASFDELFVPVPGEEDVYAYNRETKRISLDQMIYDILSVDIPLQVLCSDTCRGLCPQCGHDLNEGPCECNPEDDHAISPNNPFAKLKDLF